MARNWVRVTSGL